MINGMFILKVILSSLPIIISGILNMMFVKSKILQGLSQPIDNNICLKDGKRIFGNNKTYKGFVGMIVFTAISMMSIGLVCKYSSTINEMILFNLANNTIIQNLLYGAIWGFGYVLFELPNSFIKRRLNIESGKAGKGILKILFLIIDQVDSVLAGTILIMFFYKATATQIVTIIVVGSLVHYLINVLLYYVKLKKQRG